jgi:hypothetical protein
METPHSCSMYAEKAEQCFDEVATDPSQIVDLCYNVNIRQLQYCRCNLLFLSAHLLSTGYYKFPLQRYMALVDLQVTDH